MNESIIHQPHDKFFKQALTDKRVAKQFLKNHLPKALTTQIDFDTLKLTRHSFIDNNYKSSAADVVYSAQCGNRTFYSYLLCEQQSEVDKHMALRILTYLLRLIELHLKQYPKAKIPLVYPLVFYSGDKPWTAATDIYDLFDKQNELARELSLTSYHLIDIQRVGDEQLKQNLWSRLMEFSLKYRKIRDIKVFLKDFLIWVDEIQQQSGADYGRLALSYVGNNIESDKTDFFIEMVKTYLTGTLKGDAMTLADAFRQEGRAQGIQQGVQKGMQRGLQRGANQEKRLIAQRLLSKGLPLELVAETTGLSISRLEELIIEA